MHAGIQCCGSGMFIPSWFLPIPDLGSRIPDPKTATNRGVKKICCRTIFCSHKFHTIENYFIFEMLKKTIWTNFQIIIDLGSRIQGSKRHRIPDPDPQLCMNLSNAPVCHNRLSGCFIPVSWAVLSRYWTVPVPGSTSYWFNREGISKISIAWDYHSYVSSALPEFTYLFTCGGVSHGPGRASQETSWSGMCSAPSSLL